MHTRCLFTAVNATKRPIGQLCKYRLHLQRRKVQSRREPAGGAGASAYDNSRAAEFLGGLFIVNQQDGTGASGGVTVSYKGFVESMELLGLATVTPYDVNFESGVVLEFDLIIVELEEVGFELVVAHSFS